VTVEIARGATPRARAAGGLAWLAVPALCLVALLAPALWNHYPLLQYDTGGYLARWYEGYLVPSRSTVYGLYLHLGEGRHFWPQIVLQSAAAIWMVALTWRIARLPRSPWRFALMFVALALTTALPFLASTLLTDVFAGLGVLAMHLMIFHRNALGRWERFGLFALVTFAAATHSATLAVLLAVLAFAALRLLRSKSGELWVLVPSGGAIAAGAALLVLVNAAFSGQIAWTPGGFGIMFGRMLQDGIVKRYLDDHCPDTRLRLCPYRDELPQTADEFLWGYSIFNQLGRFNGLEAEMRFIVLHSIADYPAQQVTTAIVATADQLRLVATGYGTHDQIWHSYGIVERFIPAEVPAMRAARQQHGELNFDRINLVHVPVALGSIMLIFLMCGLAALFGRHNDISRMAATVAVAVLANAFVCGALSGPHDRYGSRLAWIATLVLMLAAWRRACDRRQGAATGVALPRRQS
jgi:hypothetical protein